MQTQVISNPSHHVVRGIAEYEAVNGRGLQLKSLTPVPFPNPTRVEQAAANMFEAAYSQIEREVTFDVRWGNGTGYFDGVCRDQQLKAQLKPGEFGRCSDEYDRKMILIGTRYGTVVIFQRYTGDSTVLVKNLPFEITRMNLIASVGMLGYDDLYLMLGKPGVGNIGMLLEAQAVSA